jgi:tyrosinase
VPLRWEVRELQRSFPDQYNLLILGLKNLEGQDGNKLTSYYQMAGIHGMPYKPWNGVGSETNWQNSSGFGGYCTHSSILFLTWHRPYLALWEVSLFWAAGSDAHRLTVAAITVQRRPGGRAEVPPRRSSGQICRSGQDLPGPLL